MTQPVITERDDRRRWPIIVSVGASILSAVLAGGVSINSAHRAVDSERKARETAAAEARKTGEQVRQAFCTMVIAQENVFREASSPVGQNAADAWHDLGILFRCY